jgi:hypothetical protein
MVNIARPGSVLVSTPIQEALEHNPAFSLKPLRPRYLQGIGRTPLWGLMHATEAVAGEEGGERSRPRGRARRRDRRPGVLLPLPEVMRERMEDRRPAWVDRLLSGPPDDDVDEPED